jgi:hypothetical protein
MSLVCINNIVSYHFEIKILRGMIKLLIRGIHLVLLRLSVMTNRRSCMIGMSNAVSHPPFGDE